MADNGIPLKDVKVLGQEQPGYHITINFTMQGTVTGVWGPDGMTLTALANHLAVGMMALTVEMLKQEKAKDSRIVVPEFGGVVPFKP